MAAPHPRSLGVPRPQFPRLCPACLPRYPLQTILRQVLVSEAPNMHNAPPKRTKLWTGTRRPGDHIGAYSTEQLERMNQEFTDAVERAFRAGGESVMAAAATYDLR